MSYWYLDGLDGVRFNYAKTPTYVCPLADAVRWEGNDVEGDRRAIVMPAVELAARELGAGEVAIASLIRSAHHRHGNGRKRDERGRLTELCAVCGHRLERLGFRCWVDRPAAGDREVERRIAGRLGFEAPRDVVRTFYVDTKREASAWARDEHRAAREAAAESSS